MYPCSSCRMKTYTFLKENHQWFLKLPDPCQKGCFTLEEVTEGSQALLNTLSRGHRKIHLRLETEPFEGADALELLQHCEAPKGGAYYQMQSVNGRPVRKKMWVRDVSLVVFGDMPDNLYYKIVSGMLYN